MLSNDFVNITLLTIMRIKSFRNRLKTTQTMITNIDNKHRQHNIDNKHRQHNIDNKHCQQTLSTNMSTNIVNKHRQQTLSTNIVNKHCQQTCQQTCQQQ